jgi:hypothetical protein
MAVSFLLGAVSRLSHLWAQNLTPVALVATAGFGAEPTPCIRISASWSRLHLLPNCVPISVYWSATTHRSRFSREARPHCGSPPGPYSAKGSRLKHNVGMVTLRPDRVIIDVFGTMSIGPRTGDLSSIARTHPPNSRRFTSCLQSSRTSRDRTHAASRSRERSEATAQDYDG